MRPTVLLIRLLGLAGVLLPERTQARGGLSPRPRAPHRPATTQQRLRPSSHRLCGTAIPPGSQQVRTGTSHLPPVSLTDLAPHTLRPAASNRKLEGATTGHLTPPFLSLDTPATGSPSLAGKAPNMSVRKRITAATTVALLLGGGVAGTAAAASHTTAPASASATSTSSSDTGTKAAPADRSTSAAAASSYYLKFHKNQRNQTKSALYLMKRVSGPDRVIKKYRAGSGVTKNSCTRNAGWLPNGTYKIQFHQRHYNGSLIKGYVIKISDKRCHNGTLRNDLFIHSEMTHSGGQGSTEPFRWDGPSDYKSSGCIKLKPAHIKNLFSTADSRGWPTKLKVVS